LSLSTDINSRGYSKKLLILKDGLLLPKKTQKPKETNKGEPNRYVDTYYQRFRELSVVDKNVVLYMQ